jgi:hypothetical protein
MGGEVCPAKSLILWRSPNLIFGLSFRFQTATARENPMRLKFEWFDGRQRCRKSIVDEEIVGEIIALGVGFSSCADRGHGGIEVSLFDGAYTITVNSNAECWGFVKGVEAVLNHMMPPKKKAVTEAALIQRPRGSSHGKATHWFSRSQWRPLRM